jgi:GT2 family glycosyltransferase
MEVPSVLAVVVVRDGAAWIRRTLSSLARQTHARFGVLAVDNASMDDSAEILEQVLGSRRVVKLTRDHGFPGAIRKVLEMPVAAEADFLLFLHDDTTLDPDAVSRLVDAAGRVGGTGVVGPKVLDWNRPEVLREVGFAADRLGYQHTPLEDGEIDQGQYDAPREVLFVSSAAMLVSREAWMRVGPPDDRLGPSHADLEFCWRVRLAGFRVLVEPRAVAFHRMVGMRRERPRPHGVHERYHADRTALAALLTNERIFTLLWVLPLFAVLGIARLFASLLSRRFDLAGEALAAWGWNLVHLPGTIKRRARSQAIRKVRDHEITRFMTPAGSRLEGWLRRGSELLTGNRSASVEEGEEPEVAPLGQRAVSMLVAHPVAVALVLGIPLILLAFRGVLFVPGIEGGAFPILPEGAGSFFEEFFKPWRTTAFGGDSSASPALLVLGTGSLLTFGNPDLLGRLVVALTPLLAGISCHLAMRRMGLSPLAAVAAAAAYALSALTLWAASEGRIGAAALLIGVPWLWGRFLVAFGEEGPASYSRWIAGTAMGLAAALSFFPAVWIPGALLLLPLVLVPNQGGKRLRGLGLVLAASVGAVVLVFPFVWSLVRAGGAGFVEPGVADFASLLRLSPGGAPGNGLPALFLPVAALVSFGLVEGAFARASGRALVVTVVAIPMAWLAAAGYFPAPAEVPAAYLAAAAFSMATLVGAAAGGLVPSARRTAFGARQMAVAAMGVILVLGLVAQALGMLPGTWGVGERRISPAWSVISTDPQEPFRVLWLGRDDGGPFPPPAGDPDGVVAAGGVRLAYGVTGSAGRSALRLRLPAHGSAFDSLESALSAVVSGRIRHGGAALAPFAIRFVVAEPDALDPVTTRRLDHQVDLDLVQREGGLLLYRSAVALPLAAILSGEQVTSVAERADPLAPTALSGLETSPLRRDGDGWSGTIAGPETGLALVTDQFDAAWSGAEGGVDAEAFPAFGWALGFEAGPGELTVRPDGLPWTLQLVALAILWAAALWAVRRRPEEIAMRPPDVAARRASMPRQPTGVSST